MTWKVQGTAATGNKVVFIAWDRWILFGATRLRCTSCAGAEFFRRRAGRELGRAVRREALSAEAATLRFFDTAAQIRSEYPYPPAPLGFEQTAVVHPWAQRFDIPLTAPPCRAPISPKSELMHVESDGDCLLPYISAGSKWHTFDAALPACDGDYVLVESSAELRAYLELVYATNPEWRARYRDGVPDAWTKQLRVVDGAAWLVERTSAMPLGRCVVLGVLVNYRRLRCV